MFDSFSDSHSFEMDSRAVRLRHSYGSTVSSMAWFQGRTAVNGTGTGLIICNSEPGYGNFADVTSGTFGLLFTSANAVPTATPATGGTRYRLANNTTVRNDTVCLSGAAVLGYNNERHDGINVLISGSSGHISGTAPAANGGSVFVALGAKAGSGDSGRFEVRTIAGSARLQIDDNTTAGETPMLLLDITAGTMRRVSIGVADSGGVGFRVLRIPN